MQGRGAVEHHGVLLDDELQSVPNGGLALLHHLLSGLDVVGQAVVHQLLHNEGAEQLDGHLLGQTALIDLQAGADHDNGTAGVVNTLTQQVLTEAALLTLQHVGQRLQGAVVGTGDGAAAAAVVNEASTASWSMRFSLRTMMSGALSWIRRFRRLLRLMTRRYRSFRSEEA